MVGDAGQQTQTLFHRAGLMLRLGQQVGSVGLKPLLSVQSCTCLLDIVAYVCSCQHTVKSALRCMRNQHVAGKVP